MDFQQTLHLVPAWEVPIPDPEMSAVGEVAGMSMSKTPTKNQMLAILGYKQEE